MDHDRSTPDTGLPEFSVNIVPTVKIRNSDLVSLLERYRRGGSDPLIFGDGNKPEAAVIPFPEFVRLMKHDHADRVREDAFQAEVSRRIHDADVRPIADEGDAEVAIEGFAEDLGPLGRGWAEERRSARPDQADDDD